MTTCTRIGCEKKLRKDNSKGVCSTNCGSMEAPPAARAKGLKVTRTELAPTGALAKFRLVAEALGKDPDQELEEFAQAWLDGLAAKLAED